MLSSILGSGGSSPGANSRARRVQMLRQQRLKAKGGAEGVVSGGPSDDESDVVVVTGAFTICVALLIVGAGAGLAALLFSIYQPECLNDLPVGAASSVVVKDVASKNRRLQSSPSVSSITGLPPQCTSQQMDILEKQLPARGCELRKDRPYARKACSFSVATTCGSVPYWLHEHIVEHDFGQGEEEFTAILVGCNNANNAIDLLRLATRDSEGKSYNVQAWSDNFVSTDNPDDKVEVRSSECPVQTVSVIPGSAPQRAQIYGIEAMPKTFQQLEKTKAALGYGDELDFTHMAVALEPDNTRVFVEDPIAAMDVGLVTWKKACKKVPSGDPRCVDVAVDKIDNWVETKPKLANNPTAPIHYMSAKVADNDYEVLKGAARTLNRVQYLDLGYNWYGDWGTSDRSLKDLMFRLKKKGFACYWPGDSGNMWRITDCWQEHYELHFSANIACVNTNITAARPLADRMERMFQETLQKTSLTFGMA